MRRTVLIVQLAGAALLASASAAPLPATLPPHPRLILTEADLQHIHKNVAAEPLAAQLYTGLLNHAAEITAKGSATGGRGDGVRDVAYTMGLSFRLTKNQTIGRAGAEALLKIARRPDICKACLNGNCSSLEANCPGTKCAQNADIRQPDPLCFGETGEGLAVGLDWLWEALTASEREEVSHTITTQIMNVYSQGLSRLYTGAYWFRSADNFNSVVNSGAVLGALAVLDEPNGQAYGDTGRFARDTLQAALLALPHGATSMYDDGSYPEGPGYGDFAISHHLAALRGLETTLGMSPSSLNVSGLANIPRYFVDIGANGFTPSGASYNWGDGGTGSGSWLPVSLARRYADTIGDGWVYAARRTVEQAIAGGGCQVPTCHNETKGGKEVRKCGKFGGEPSCAMMLADFDGRGTAADLKELTPSHLYPGTAVGVLRSSWSNRGVWVGLKGGDNSLQQVSPQPIPATT